MFVEYASMYVVVEGSAAFSAYIIRNQLFTHIVFVFLYLCLVQVCAATVQTIAAL